MYFDLSETIFASAAHSCAPSSVARRSPTGAPDTTPRRGLPPTLDSRVNRDGRVIHFFYNTHYTPDGVDRKRAVYDFPRTRRRWRQLSLPPIPAHRSERLWKTSPWPNNTMMRISKKQKKKRSDDFSFCFWQTTERGSTLNPLIKNNEWFLIVVEYNERAYPRRKISINT